MNCKNCRLLSREFVFAVFLTSWHKNGWETHNDERRDLRVTNPHLSISNKCLTRRHFFVDEVLNSPSELWSSLSLWDAWFNVPMFEESFWKSSSQKMNEILIDKRDEDLEIYCKPRKRKINDHFWRQITLSRSLIHHNLHTITLPWVTDALIPFITGNNFNSSLRYLEVLLSIIPQRDRQTFSWETQTIIISFFW